MATNERRRARRIAADEAHAWARNLRLRNHHAKSVLRSLTLYVDGDGYSFVGIPTLAEDCELSDDTVRRRLQWLEDIGAITRHPQWIDERGVRNGDARGKRTSDHIRLMLDADPTTIEARASGVEAVSREVSPSSQRGLNPADETVNPAPALGQPSHCGEGLISEPEPEDSPKVPSGDESESNSVEEVVEPEHFGGAWASWRGHEVMRRDLALEEFRKLTAEQQRLCRAAIPLFFQMQDRLGRKHPPNFHLWIRNRGFDEFPNATLEPTAAGATGYDVSGREGRAIKALYGFARVPLWEHGGRVVYPLPVTAQVLAFAEAPPASEWHWIEERAQIAAWSTFLSAHVHRSRPQLLRTRGIGEAQRHGFDAPWPWPPRKDGTISPIENSQGEGADGLR